MSDNKNCGTRVADKIDGGIHGFFHKLGHFCASRPKTTLAIALTVAVACASGMAKLNTESRPEKLWVPQNTQAEDEQTAYLGYFPPTARFQNAIISAAEEGGDKNVLTKSRLESAMEIHLGIQSGVSETDGEKYQLNDLCVPSGAACATYDFENPVCGCLVTSVLKVWNYELETLQADEDIIATLNTYGSRSDLEGVLGNPVFDSTDALVSAEAISMSYFLSDRSEVENGGLVDPINEAWEESVFLKNVESPPSTDIEVAYLSSRSFSDEFGGAITGDLVFVNVSYIVAFLFLGATLGSKVVCGEGSRWAMSGAAIVLVALATVAGFGISSLAGLIYSPVHSVLPFVLIGIGVDDSFVIANAFDRERKVARKSETDEGLVQRGAKSLARAGASITVTSLTDLVAFAISSSSALPALGSFCAFASICIFFLWAFAATFFTAAMVLDEKRQKQDRRDCLCCLSRPNKTDEASNSVLDKGAKEGRVATYFRKYHAPAILSKPGKAFVLLAFAGLFGFGIFGTISLPVEDSERNFIPADSYINDYADAGDEYFPTSGISLYTTFEGGAEIYAKRDLLTDLASRVSGKEGAPTYISEPDSDSTYSNVLAGMKSYLDAAGSDGVGGAALGEDGWPTTYDDFVTTLSAYTSRAGPGGRFAQDVAWTDDTQTDILAYRTKFEYVRLTKEFRGKTLDDAEKQIEAMDATREMVEGWTDLPPVFPYSAKFISIEGFKIISTELYRNVGLAIATVGVIVLITVANLKAAFLITLNVAMCIIEILGFMYALGLVIDSVSVINIVLAVGLSVDYSAHVGHCFCVKGGNDKNVRATEALADIGTSVLNGALSTFLAVAVLLGSSSYVFKTLSTQFALTVCLGSVHGLVLLPVMLSLVGPAPFSSAEPPAGEEEVHDLALKDEEKEPKDISKDVDVENASSEEEKKENDD